jgi:hypothetical protein
MSYDNTYYNRAVSIIARYLDLGSTELYFSSVNTDILPPIPPQITRLTIRGGLLGTLDISNTNITELIIGNNTRIARLILNDSLVKLDVHKNTRVGKLDSPVPLTIEYFSLSCCKRLPYGLPRIMPNIKYMRLYELDGFKQIPYCPKLETLSITECPDLIYISSFPSRAFEYVGDSKYNKLTNILPYLDTMLVSCIIHLYDNKRLDNSVFCKVKLSTDGSLEKCLFIEGHSHINDLTDIVNTFRMPIAVQRTAIFKEELMQRCWHPDRVARWVEQGVDEMMMGI